MIEAHCPTKRYNAEPIKPHTVRRSHRVFASLTAACVAALFGGRAVPSPYHLTTHSPPPASPV
ncbi:hypothetical protein C5746_37950 [Streptomyces atratus]|uniref:Uncharacterized protein n=1 Tax=Streptomyces atratus TaxID=1893 RepID=A0A2Z5JNE7_STRAR|nr:hypothetical protein C5746_37950 [Streptomyces atratus]